MNTITYEFDPQTCIPRTIINKQTNKQTKQNTYHQNYILLILYQLLIWLLCFIFKTR